MTPPDLRARILRFVAARPGCKGHDITEACTVGRHKRSDVRNALTAMTRDGSLVSTGPNGHQTYTIGQPVTEDHSAAIAHLQAFGDLGAEILRLAAEYKVSPTALLAGRSQTVGRVRGIIISRLTGPREVIAAAMKKSATTVRVYRASPSEAA